MSRPISSVSTASCEGKLTFKFINSHKNRDSLPEIIPLKRSSVDQREDYSNSNPAEIIKIEQDPKTSLIIPEKIYKKHGRIITIPKLKTNVNDFDSRLPIRFNTDRIKVINEPIKNIKSIQESERSIGFLSPLALNEKKKKWYDRKPRLMVNRYYENNFAGKVTNINNSRRGTVSISELFKTVKPINQYENPN